MAMVRRNYKDSLFLELFGTDENRANALELYNALAGTSHSDASELELTTVGNMVFLGRKNDVSFLVGNDIVLIEHQSTSNPNMPLRGLLYFAKLFNKLIDSRGIDLYSATPIKLPRPQYFVLYFGPEERPDREVLRLSDLMPGVAGSLEVEATVLNCNEGRNVGIMEACESLRGYSHLLALARGGRRRGLGLDDAVCEAVSRCIDEGVLSSYLSAHRAEAIEMLFTIEDEERAMRVHWETVEREAREKGYADGQEKGFSDGRNKGYADGQVKGMAKGMDALTAELRARGIDESLLESAVAAVRAANAAD